MKVQIKTIIASLALFLTLSQAQAQETLAQELSDLMRLEGHWEGQTSLMLEGNTFSFVYHLDFRKTADGKGLLMEEWFNSPDVGMLMGTNLIGYNANDAKIHWFSVDNFGTTHDHIGMWKSKDHFCLETSENIEGKQYLEKIDFLFKGNDKVEIKLIATLGGQEYETISGTLKRMAKCLN